MNCWMLCKELIKLDDEIKELMDFKKTDNSEWIDKEIDRKLNRQLIIKHKLEDIEGGYINE